MCRLAAFYSGSIKRNDILDILLDMENRGTDGIGECHIESKKFVINKYPIALSKLLKRKHVGDDFLSHFNDKDYRGWTIVHLRAATHGSVCKNNTHPWNVGNYAVCHNGVWRGHELHRLVLKNLVKFQGETDSETAAHLINLLGPKKFSENMDIGSGVYLALNLNGDLWVSKVSGDLEIAELKDNKVFLSSEIAYSETLNTKDIDEGWYHFSSNGEYLNHKNRDKQYFAERYYNGKFEKKTIEETNSIPRVKTYDMGKKYLKTYPSISGMDPSFYKRAQGFGNNEEETTEHDAAWNFLR
jgi:predicted glutamine amidotransferase